MIISINIRNNLYVKFSLIYNAHFLNFKIFEKPVFLCELKPLLILIISLL